MKKNRVFESNRGRGWLQRQCAYAFAALTSATTAQLIEWARPELVYMERRPLKKWEWDNVVRAAKSIGAKKVERCGHGVGVAVK
jgi:hypothetical protein